MTIEPFLSGAVKVNDLESIELEISANCCFSRLAELVCLVIIFNFSVIIRHQIRSTFFLITDPGLAKIPSINLQFLKRKATRLSFAFSQKIHQSVNPSSQAAFSFHHEYPRAFSELERTSPVLSEQPTKVGILPLIPLFFFVSLPLSLGQIKGSNEPTLIGLRQEEVFILFRGRGFSLS